MAWDVLILGGGFGGLYAARKLEKLLPPHSARVTLVNDVNFMLYTPLLPGAAGGTLEPRHVVVPLREQLAHTHLRLARVTAADPTRNEVTILNSAGAEEQLHYDQLVVTIGSTSRTLPIPGLKEHAMGVKTLSEAISIRNRLQTLEIAESTDDAEARAALLGYVVVGAGYAGVETIAELQDFASDVLDYYPRCSLHGLRFVLVEARDRLMPEISESLASFASAELQRRGIEVRLGTTLERVSHDSVELSTGEIVPTRTVGWTAGVKPHPIVSRLGLPLDDAGRIRVDRFCQVDGLPNVWAIGDAAAVPDPARPGSPCPPTCQHALRQGRTAGRNVAAALGVGSKRPFTYKTLGVFVDMGRHQAVAETVGIRWRGFPAWFLARSYHLSQMPGLRRRFRLVTDWTVGLLFGRDSSELGQLGHPPVLEDPVLEEQSVGGTTPPGLSTAALALVLASAAVHALWNTLLADASDTHASTAVGLVAGALVAAPVAAVGWDVDGSAAPYLLASAAFELVYFALLATAYSRADLTFVYPVARGSAPVLVLVISLVFLGVEVGWLQALGVLAVVGGVLLVRGVGRVEDPAALMLALGVGACIAGYTLIDDHGLHHAAAVPYFACVAVLMAVPYTAAVWARAGGAALRAAVSWRAVVMGVGMFVAYALTLAALELAEAAPVAALRETSVVMAAIAAAVMGREPAAAGRIAGAAVVVAGVAAIALG